MKLVANSKYQKLANSSLIIKEIMKAPISRVALANKLGLQPSTVTYSTARLIEIGLVKEVASDSIDGKKGRKSILLGLDPNYGVVCGVELLVASYRVIVSNVAGVIIANESFVYDDSVNAEKGTRERFVQILSCIRNKLEESRGSLRICGACLAIAGIVSQNGQKIIDSWTHGLSCEDFSKELAEYDYPIFFENDANCAAQKYLLGNKYNFDSYLYVLVHYYKPELIPKSVPSVGIGMGVVIDGSLYRGWTNRAGEFRSVFFSRNTQIGQLSLSNDELIALGQDRETQKIFTKEVLSNLFSAEAILNPRVIYLCGDLISKEVVDEVIEEDFASLKNEFLKTEVDCLQVVEDYTWDVSYGACSLVLDYMFQVPKLGDNQLGAPWKWQQRIS